MTEHEVIIEFELKDEKITNSTDKIISTFESLKNSFSQNVNQTVSKGLQDLARQSNKVSKPLKQIKDHSKASALSIGALATSTIMATKKIIQLTNESANFIGVQTRFNSIFGTSNEELKEAQKWVKEYSEALYLDSKEVMNINSSLALLAKNLGFSNDKATEMSRNLTQLAYDMSAVAGTSLDETFTAIRSGLGGEAEALKKYGVYLNQATLQNTLYANGINRTVSSLNAAERAELAYYQIMKTTAGQQGYLAKTLMSPANAANILRTQFTLLGRSIGNLFLPILMKLLPVVVAVTQALTRMAEALAAFFGINIDFSDYGSDIGGISSGIDGIGDSADGASKKIKNMLRDFDDLHVVDFGDDSGSGGGIGGGIGGGTGGLGLDVQQYADWNKYLDDINTKLSISEEWVSAIVGGLAGLTIGGIVGKVLELCGVLDKGHGKALILAGALAGIGISLTFDAQKDILENGLNAENITNTILGAITAGASAYLVARKFGASPGLALTIALTVTLSLMAINFLTPIAENAQKFVLEKFGNYGNAAGRIYADEMNKSIEINGTKVPITVSEVLMKTNGAVDENLNEMQNMVDSSTRTMYDNFGLGFSNINDAVKNETSDMVNNVSTQLDTMKSNSLTSTNDMSRNMHDTFNVLSYNIGQSASAIKNAVDSNFSSVSNSANTYFKNTRFNIEGGITGAEKTVKTSVAGIKTNMNSAYGSIQTGSMDMKNDLDSNLNGARNSFSNLSSDSKRYSDEVKRNLASISNAKVKTPKFSWSLATKAVGTIAKVLSALSLPTMLPTLNVGWYASGGFPDKGDLFIANEREPELIGTMGNKTTVANGMQIIEGIASASYTGMKRALQEVDWGSGDTLVYVGNKQLTDVVTKQQNFNNKKYGR